MKIPAQIQVFALAALLACTAGCRTFKPVVEETRYFVVSPSESTAAPGVDLAKPVGIGPVAIPDYLLTDRLALRVGENEIRYLANLQWAERLDKNLQRVLAANIGRIVGPANVLAAAWRSDEVSAEVYVSVIRFDLMENGEVALHARWLITAPGGVETRFTGVSRINREGASLAHPEEAVGALSAAWQELSETIAAQLGNATAAPQP